MASIMKRGKTWSYRVNYVDSDGNRRQINKGGFKRKALAEAAAAEMEREKQHGANPSDQEIRLIDYWDAWVKRYKIGKHSTITEKRYPIIRKTLKQYFDNTLMRDLRPSDWQEFLNDYGKNHSKITVSKLNGYVRSMAKAAINDQIIYTDFTFGAQLTGKAGKRDADKFVQADELEAIMAKAYSRADFDHITNCIIYLGAVSGARYSELIGLTWKDINFSKLTININKTWDYHFNQGFLPTKTPSSVRIVRVTKPAMTMLKRLKADQSAYFVKTGTRDDQHLVFRAKRGQVPTNAAANKMLSKIEDEVEQNLRELKKVKDPDQQMLSTHITFHGLRHSHVSYLLSQHVDIYYISRRLGHSDISITLSIYSHLLDTLQTEQEDLTINALSKLEG